MFDAGLRGVGDAAVVEAIADFARQEAQAAAARLGAIAELVARRCADDERAYWACDEWDAAAAEVSAALGVTHGRASSQMMTAMSLRHRFPRIAALFSEGQLSSRVCEAIVDRTYLVQDRGILAVLDEAIAADAVTWGPMSALKLQRAIDHWVDQHDPGALRRTRTRMRDREVVVDLRNTRDGVVDLWGKLSITDGAVLDRRLTVMAHSVCEDDPRTLGQRRADALGALGAGCDHLACRCDNPDCPAAEPDGRAASVVVHLVGHADALEAESDPAIHGEEPDTEPEPTTPTGGILTGHRGIVPTTLLAELIRNGATVRPLRRPGEEPEPHYRPSTALDEFVRLRDLTCRFPNCDQPAEYCDIDHTIPWPYGPTHASNLACICRKHHLLKTFWAGWHDQQHSDGTLVWTSPTGHTYTTTPGSRLFLPRWNTTTATLTAAVGQPPPTIGIMMPTRRKTRAAQHRQRIAAERTLNDAYVTERNRPPPF